MTHKKTLNKTIDYIKEHIDEKLSTKIIAEYAGYSVYYFGRMFKEYTGKTIMAYVRDMRLELAKDDFDENRVCDLAEKFGYGTTSGFSRAYKRHFGECPSGSRMNA